MAYYPRLSMEQPLKTNQKINKLHIPNSSYLKSFKKSVGNSFVGRSKTEMNQYSLINDENIRTPKIREKSQGQKNKSQLHQLQFMMQDADNSMEQLLNSSINQFQKLIMHEEVAENLEQQNYRLKNALVKMKTILKDKLETALQKQKDELSKMLEDYISLITKLLQDKQQLTLRIQQLVDEGQKRVKQLQHQYSSKIRLLNEQREEYINSTKNQIDDFLQIIEQYEEEAQQQQTKFNEMKKKVEQLEEQREVYLKQSRCKSFKEKDEGYGNEIEARIEAQSTKIQTLLQLLQKTQSQNNDLKMEINNLKAKESSRMGTNQIKQIKQEYQKRLQELEEEHEEEFLEYEKAIKDTLVKKDECIERLNVIIEGLRERKAQTAY